MNDPDEGNVVICGGGANPTDTHLDSIVHCVDGEIIQWLEWRERRKRDRLAPNSQSAYKEFVMSWNAKETALLRQLWAAGQSAAEIAHRLGYSRNAVCAKLRRLGLHRGHKPPTAKPKIVPVPKQRPVLLAACARPVDKVVSSRKRVTPQPKQLTKRQLYAMLAEAVRNTG